MQLTCTMTRGICYVRKIVVRQRSLLVSEEYRKEKQQEDSALKNRRLWDDLLINNWQGCVGVNSFSSHHIHYHHRGVAFAVIGYFGQRIKRALHGPIVSRVQHPGLTAMVIHEIIENTFSWTWFFVITHIIGNINLGGQCALFYAVASKVKIEFVSN